MNAPRSPASGAPSSDSDEATLAEAHATAGLLMGVAERSRHHFEAVASRHGLTPPQLRALLALDSLVPMRSLAGTLGCDASNVTGIADRLEERGLVAREAAPGDRRVKLLVATPEGQRIRAAIEAEVVRDAPFVAALTAPERATLRELLGKVVGAGQDPTAPVSGGEEGARDPARDPD